MLVYAIAVRPFKTKTNTFIAIYNETYLLLTIFCILLLNKIDPSQTVQAIFGWILSGLLIVPLVFSWISIVPPIAKTIWAKIKHLWRRLWSNQKNNGLADLAKQNEGRIAHIIKTRRIIRKKGKEKSRKMKIRKTIKRTESKQE